MASAVSSAALPTTCTSASSGSSRAAPASLGTPSAVSKSMALAASRFSTIELTSTATRTNGATKAMSAGPVAVASQRRCSMHASTSSARSMISTWACAGDVLETSRLTFAAYSRGRWQLAAGMGKTTRWGVPLYQRTSTQASCLSKKVAAASNSAAADAAAAALRSASCATAEGLSGCASWSNSGRSHGMCPISAAVKTGDSFAASRCSACHAPSVMFADTGSAAAARGSGTWICKCGRVGAIARSGAASASKRYSV